MTTSPRVRRFRIDARPASARRQAWYSKPAVALVPAAVEPAALERQAAAEEALLRLCYDAARTRYLELAAWRMR